jgi:hypothetical protein
MNALPEDIERLALLGWRLHPACSTTRSACFPGATDAATCDLDQLAAWSRAYSGCSWRTVMQGSGIWGLDLDVPSLDHAADGVAAFAELVQQQGGLPVAPTLRSGGGGLAVIFHDTGAPIRGQTGWPAPGIDPRRGRQSITVPPSRHVRTRRPYTWVRPPWDVAPPPAPAWLLRLMAPAPQPVPVRRPFVIGADPDKARRYAAAALRNASQRVASAGDGTRNHTLNIECYALARFIAEGSLSGIEVAQAMAAAALQVGLDAREAAATIASALRARWAA